MNRGIRGKFPKLNEYTRATNTTESYDTGDLMITAEEQFFFWGKIEDKRSINTVLGGKRLDHKDLLITVRTRDVGAVDIGTEIELDSNTFLYQVQDKFESDFKFHSHLVCAAITNR